MTRFTRRRGVLAALVLAVAAAIVPTAAAQAITPILITFGTLSGTLSAGSDHSFNFTFVPVTGTGSPDTVAVTTDGSNHFSLTHTFGNYQVLVQSTSGGHAAEWYPAGQQHANNGAGHVAINILSTTTVSWTMDAGHSVTGKWVLASGSTSHQMKVDAYPWDIGFRAWQPDAIPSATATVGANTNFVLSGLASGIYLLVLRDTSTGTSGRLATTYSSVGVGSSNVTLPSSVSVTPAATSFTRLSGSDRFATSVAIANSQFSNPSSVFIVNGQNFPDALSAGPAAASQGAPVLLVAPGSIPSSVKSYLQSHNSSIANVYIIGGTASVSAAVATQLGSYGTVTRISGADRYATSLAVAKFGFFTSQQTTYIANGNNFPDALSAGPAAWNGYGPVVLVNGGSNTLDGPTTLYLQSKAADPIQIAGGSNSVSTGIESNITAIQNAASGSPLDAPRRAGSDRYATSAIIAAADFGHAGYDSTTSAVYLSVGTNFPDALAGGAAAAVNYSPILLVQQSCVPQATLDQIHRLAPNHIYLLGGTTTLSNSLTSLPVC